MNRTSVPRGYTLLEVVCAATLGAAMLVPMTSLLRTTTEKNQKIRVRDAMVLHAESLLEQVRVAVADPLEFSRAAAGAMPTGIVASGRATLFPGEIAQHRIAISPYDSARDLISIEVVVNHQNSGLIAVGDTVRIVSQIARPW